MDINRIFVVEDDEEDSALLRDAFSEVGARGVKFFKNPFDVIKHLENTDDRSLPKLLVTDYKMPKLDGFNLAAFLKRSERFSLIAIVVISSVIHENEKHRLLSAGVSKIYTKPDSYEGLQVIAGELNSLAR